MPFQVEGTVTATSGAAPHEPKPIRVDGTVNLKPVQSPDELKPIPHRWWANAALFLALSFFATLYACLHWKDYVSQAVFLGGTMSAWGLVQLGKSGWKAAKHKKIDLSVQSRLERPQATEWLIIALIGLAVLFASTASIHVKLGDDHTSGDVRVAMDVRGGTLNVIDTLSLDKGHQQVSRTYFMWPGDRSQVRFAVVGSRDREPKGVALNASDAVRIEVPDGFTRTKLFLLRIVPGPGTFRLLQRQDGSPPGKWKLVATVRDTAYTLADLRRGVVYAGADKPTLTWRTEADPPERWLDDIRWHWTELSMKEAGEEVASACAKSQVMLPTGRITETDEVVVTILQDTRRVATTTVRNLREGINTIYVESPAP